MEKIKTFFKSVYRAILKTGKKGIIIGICACIIIAAAIALPLIFVNIHNENSDTDTFIETEESHMTTESNTDSDTETSLDTNTDTSNIADTETEKKDTETEKSTETQKETQAPDNNEFVGNENVDINVSVSGGQNTSGGNSSNNTSSSNPLGSSETNGRVHCYADAPSKEYEDNSTTLPHYPLKGGTTEANGIYNKPQILEKDIKPGVVLKGDADYSTTIIGYDNFLFCGDTMGDYDGTSLYVEELLKNLVNKVVEQKKWLESNNKKLYIVIVPNKNSVYSEYMPDNYSLASYRRIDQVINALRNAGITVIDGRDSLIAAKKSNPERLLYYKTDTHWNNHGGFEVYKELMNQIKKDFPNAVLHTRSDYQVNYEETYMKDQAYYLGYYDATKEIGPVYTLKNGETADLLSYTPKDKWGQFKFTYDWPDGYSDHLYYFSYINYSNKKAPNMYILRDSYSIALTPFLKDSFYKSTYNWSYYFSKNDILKSKADVVIIECVEKHIKDMLQATWGN